MNSDFCTHDSISRDFSSGIARHFLGRTVFMARKIRETIVVLLGDIREEQRIFDEDF